MAKSICMDCHRDCEARDQVTLMERQLQTQKNTNKKLRAQVKKLVTVNQLEFDFGAN